MSSQINCFSLISIIVVVNVIVIGFTLTLTQWLGDKKVGTISSFDVMLYLMILLFLSTICMVLVLTGKVTLKKSSNAKEGPYRYILYVGLYIFGIGTILLDLLETVASIRCAVDVQDLLNRSSSIPQNYTTSLEQLLSDYRAFSAMFVIKSLYIIIQLSMLSRFRGYKTKTHASKFAVMTTLATNSALYIFTFIQEAQERLDGASFTNVELLNYTVRISAHNVTECLHLNTSIQQTVSTAEKYMYPFDMEFCLVAVGMLLSMFLDDDVIDDEQDEESALAESGSGSPGAAVENDQERTPLLASSRSLGARHRPAVINPCKFAFNFAILLSIVLILIESLRYDEDLSNSLQIAFYIARITYYTLLLVVTVIGAWLVYTSTNVKIIKLHPETILLLVAATGECIYLYFGLLSSTTVFDSSKLNQMLLDESKQDQTTISLQTLSEVSWLILFTNTMDLVQIGAQTYILIEAVGCRGEQFRWGNQENKKRYWLEEVLLYLCVCNFFKWATDSFVEGNFLSSSEATTLVFGEKTWKGITQSIYPLVLFFRFHSVLMIIGVVGYV